MIIDAWMQHPSAEWIADPMFDSLRRWRPGKWSEKAHPILDTLAEMDRAGVSLGMLCAWHGPHGPMISNDEVARYCRAYPDRFVGIASVDLFRPLEAVRELRLRVKRDGFKGLRILPWLWGLPPDHRRYYPLFAECCELDIPFSSVHVLEEKNVGEKRLGSQRWRSRRSGRERDRTAPSVRSASTKAQWHAGATGAQSFAEGQC